MHRNTVWFYSKGRQPHSMKKVKGMEEWFYTGPSRYFGHPNDKTKRKRGK